MTVALVTGISGQDGWYLAHHLHTLGVDVVGLARPGHIPVGLPFVRLAPPADMRDSSGLEQAIAATAPDHIYHLAAQSSVPLSWDDPVGTSNVTGLGTARLLDAVRRAAPAAKVLVASSSAVFGTPTVAPQDETTPFRPESPYAAAKAFAHSIAQIHREHLGLFVSIGILFNHESPRRERHAVTRKITQGVAAIARCEQRELRLGNLEARRDWGFAGDYVRAMHLMLQQDQPGDYVIATGETHSVREFCAAAFARAGLDYRGHVVSDPAYWRPAEAVPLVGNATKAREMLGWRPTVSFDELVDLMVDADLANSIAS